MTSGVAGWLCLQAFSTRARRARRRRSPTRDIDGPELARQDGRPAKRSLSSRSAPAASPDVPASSPAPALPWHFDAPRISVIMTAAAHPRAGARAGAEPSGAALLPGSSRRPAATRPPGRLVIDDVVDPAPAVLHGRHGRISGVLDVDERPHSRAVADDREPAPADRLQVLAVGAERAGAVEASVAE